MITSLMLSGFASMAQTVHSIITCPSEDTSSQMKISWASQEKGTFVVYSPTEGGKGPFGLTVKPEQEEYCIVFDGIKSKTAIGDDTFEDVKFYKCGATLSGLRKETKYVYYICDKDGNRMCDDHYFKTSGAKRWSACIISDFHHYTPLPARLASAMNMIGTVRAYDPSFDWTLHIGDVAAWGGSYSFWKTLYREPEFSKNFWAGLNGNHDNMTRVSDLSNQFFRNVNYLPQNGYEGEMGVCYYFRYSDALFIMLNNEEMRSDEGLAAAQKWVKDVVTSQRSSDNAPKYVIVCEHYQWFYGGDGSFSQYSRWHELFDELGVDLAIGANNHIYVRSNPIKDGKVVSPKEGTVYLQSSSSDNERGQDMDSEITHNQELIVKRWTEGGKTVSAMDMKVTPRKITITLIDRYGQIHDQFSIPAKR